MPGIFVACGCVCFQLSRFRYENLRLIACLRYHVPRKYEVDHILKENHSPILFKTLARGERLRCKKSVGIGQGRRGQEAMVDTPAAFQAISKTVKICIYCSTLRLIAIS